DVAADGLTAVGRIGHLHGRTVGVRARHQRGGGPRAGVGVDRVGHGFQFVVVGEVDAHGILPEFAIQIDWQGNAGVRDGSEAAHRFARVGDQFAYRQCLIDDAVDEAGVGTVL